MAVRKLRAGVFGGIAMLGAGVMLSACSPVQMGAAAIVGNQRITQSDLSANVTDLQNAITKAKVPASEMQLAPTQFPRAVLGLMVEFSVMNRLAQNAGVSVSPAQVNDETGMFLQEMQQSAQQSQGANPDALIFDQGIGPKLLPGVGRFLAEKTAIAKKLNGGKIPTSQAETQKLNTELNRLEAPVQKDIKVNPQYGKFDLSKGTIVDGPDLLSKAVNSAVSNAAPASS